jgi:hypothetical protein
MRRSTRVWLLGLSGLALVGCDGDVAPIDGGRDAGADASPADAGTPDITFVAVTFNTGTSSSQPHDNPPDDGYGSAEATISDTYYGDGLAWMPVVDATERFFLELSPDVVAFQEIFYAGDCPSIPPEDHVGWFCEGWSVGDPTVANVILGMGYQVACQLGKPDKCLAVNRRFGTFRGCDADLCLDFLDGAPLMDCGSGSRVGRGVIDLTAGGSITVVNVHGTSGITATEQDCRVRQFDQVFVDLDGEPAANGAINLILGDLNTDPARLASGDPSAARFSEFVGDGKPFHFISAVGRTAEPTYAGLFNIDHVASDGLSGSCTAAGITEGHPGITDIVYFDHRPVVCTISGDLP